MLMFYTGVELNATNQLQKYKQLLPIATQDLRGVQLKRIPVTIRLGSEFFNHGN
jgi:hypothetical protein